MITSKVLCLLALPAFLFCGEAAAKNNGAPKQASSAAAKSSMARQATGTAQTSGRQPSKVGGTCPPFMCGTDSNGPQLTGLQAASGLIAVSAVTLASGEAIALR